MIREWLSSNPVGIEDGLRHDKWLAMMWPRLRLLKELLAEDGSFWMTLDDNEAHRGRLLLDEIFGEDAFVAQIAWQARYSVSSDAAVSNSHNYVLVYSKAPETWKKLRNEVLRDEKQSRQYSNPDNDPDGPWRSIPWDAPNVRENLSYPIITPKGTVKRPPPGRCWSREESKWLDIVGKGLAYFGQNDDGAPAYKRYLKDAGTVVPTTWWPHDGSGHTDEASKELRQFTLDVQFATPKPTRLLERILSIATRPDSVVLDSCAGSGTTADAVLRLNHRDGGNRRFILVECEDYADTLTAERVRRVINGYSFQGTQREELHREKLTFTKLKKSGDLLAQVESIKNLEGHRFDKIKAEVKDGALIVTGEKQVAERTEGLGGAFTFCTLGEPVELDRLLTGAGLPAVEPLAALLFHTATNQVQPSRDAGDPECVEGCRYLGASTAMHVWLIYEPDLGFLKSRDAALTLSRARAIAAAKPDKPNLVFAAARFVSQRILNDEHLNVEFAPLPFALYRIERT
jgi:adenine-specific DNA-methyltransferase